jgi:hypothetical protein
MNFQEIARESPDEDNQKKYLDSLRRRFAAGF